MIKHYTASAFVFCQMKNVWKLLLVHHKRLGAWVVPGGHVEPNENPVEAAQRETLEETGLAPRLISFLHHPLQNLESRWLLPPEYLLEHEVPAWNNEPAHYHIDCVYVGVARAREISLQKQELHDAAWFSAEEVQHHANVFASTQKIAQILFVKLNANQPCFYQEKLPANDL